MLLLIFDWGKLIGTLESLALEKKNLLSFQNFLTAAI